MKTAKNKKFIKRLIIGLLTSFIIAMILLYRYHLHYLLLKLLTPKVEIENEEKFADLHPVFKYNAYKFLKELKSMGYKIIATSGYRSFEKQNELYTSGQTTAPAGHSLHNYGLALDLNLIDPNGKYLKMTTARQHWEEAAKIGEKHGLRWGGTFSDFYDPVHFDLKNKYPDIHYLKNLYENSEVVNQKFVKI